MFAGDDDRLGLAVALAASNHAPLLVVSRGHLGYGGPCPAAPAAQVKVVCFEPVPANTRGEAEFAGRLAAQEHWGSLLLVTSRVQDTRARLLMSRCFGGSVYVLGAQPGLSELPGQIAYEWGALLKALVLERTC
jgi:hypothetical protein